MKPIIILGIIAVASIALGAGSLTNVINLTVQDFGVGEETIESPVNSADVKFVIQATIGNSGFFKNYISDCKISSPEQIDAGSRIFCKLTDENSKVIAEGNKLLTTFLPPNVLTVIPIDDPNIINSQVQNVHDVLVVIQGPKVQP